MKQYFLLSLSFILCLPLLAQISQGGIPPSFQYRNNTKVAKSNLSPHIYKLKADVKRLIWEDEMVEQNGGPVRIAAVIPDTINILSIGEWSDLPNGQRICQTKLESPDAKGLVIIYNRFYIPQGGQLFIYNAAKTQVLGAYTHLTNPQGKEFSTEIVNGDELIFEYVDPQNGSTPQIVVSGIGHIYKSTKADEIGFGKSKSCEVNINCSEGINWQQQKRGVAKTLTHIDGWLYACSGTLINNTSEDFTPYFLSAYHCFYPNLLSSPDFNTMQFYFNYELSGCENGAETEDDVDAKTKIMVGAQLLVSNPIYGGLDGALLKLKAEIPTNYDVVFNGWDRNTSDPTSGVGIHHPSADVKKISTYTTPLRTGTYFDKNGRSTENAHWLIRFAATTNGFGITEGGSSGSPLFNKEGRIVGSLTGGTTTCTNPNQDDFYSKFSFQWDKGNDPSGKQMQNYLDPQNKGVSYLNLMEQLPDITVSADTINIKENVSVQISILSGNGGYTDSSADPEVATSSILGNDVLIKGIKEGQTTVTIKDAENKTKKIVVYVYSRDSDPVTLRLYNGILSFNMMSDSNDYISVIDITDLWGRILYSEAGLKQKLQHQVDLSSISKGIYVVKVKTNKGYSKTQKIKW